MGLADYLWPESICMGLHTRQRDEAVRELLGRLAETAPLSDELVEEALEAVLQREQLGSTAIGRGVAVPHARVEELDSVLVAFGYSESGVAFEALDRQPVHEIFLVIAPRDHTEEYVGVMERITRLVQDDDFRRFVSRAKTPGEVVELIQEMDR